MLTTAYWSATSCTTRSTHEDCTDLYLVQKGCAAPCPMWGKAAFLYVFSKLLLLFLDKLKVKRRTCQLHLHLFYTQSMTSAHIAHMELYWHTYPDAEPTEFSTKYMSKQQKPKTCATDQYILLTWLVVYSILLLRNHSCYNNCISNKTVLNQPFWMIWNFLAFEMHTWKRKLVFCEIS